MLLYCTPETVKALRDGLAKRKQATEPPDKYFPSEVIAILKALDLAGMAHYNYINDPPNQLEYSKDEYSQEDITKARENTYLLVGVVESLLDENTEIQDQLETAQSEIKILQDRLAGYINRSR